MPALYHERITLLQHLLLLSYVIPCVFFILQNCEQSQQRRLEILHLIMTTANIYFIAKLLRIFLQHRRLQVESECVQVIYHLTQRTSYFRLATTKINFLTCVLLYRSSRKYSSMFKLRMIVA